VAKLIDEGDRLLEQRQFNKAIKLYERAYRLAPADQNNYIRLLVAKRAAGVMTKQDRQALDILEEGRIAELDQIFRGVRLKIIQARGAL
jgi:tetratricopeptide (TPR) repeat protein